MMPEVAINLPLAGVVSVINSNVAGDVQITLST